MARGVAKVGVLGQLWSALDPRVADRGNWEDNTTHMLRLLMVAMLIFGAIVAAWAIGASVMRTIWLSQLSNSADGMGPGQLNQTLLDPITWIFTLFQIVRGVGGTLALCAVGGLAGAALGFLFGLPNPPSGGASRAQSAPGAQSADGNGSQRDQSWRLSSNLIKIADWLTTAIVGVSLFEAQRAFGFFGDHAQLAAGWLFNGRHGSNAVLPGAIAGSAVLGFLFVNLSTQLIVSRLLAKADYDLAKVWPGVIAQMTLVGIKSIREGLVPRISRSKSAPEPQDQPTPDEVDAALKYIDITFDDLMSRSDIEAEEVLSWARAKAVLNDYRAAAKGYIYLLGKDHG